ncbi:MAG: LptF/LptG family permease [Sphaerochaetaceae bacterium]|nr:LptF/LptG family permease [Sphaerochaetaceae bacterium]
MKKLDRYIIFSILKTGIATLLLCTFMVIAIQLFLDMNNIISSNAKILDVILLSIYGLPEYMMMVSSISFLFATTYFLSQLVANNELIILYNSGLSYRRILRPIVLLAIILSLIFSFMTENLFISMTKLRDMKRDELFGRSSTHDNRNVNFLDTDEEYLLHANSYRESNQSLNNITIVNYEDGNITSRLEANTATFNKDTKVWDFKNVTLFNFIGNTVEIEQYQDYSKPRYHLEPRLFKNLSGSIKSMPLQDAKAYLNRMEKLDINAYRENVVDLIDRLFSPYSILILMLISCSMSYRFKKNVFLFSIIQSLCTAVVYYVAQMVLAITTKQGFSPEYVYLVGPIILVVFFVILIKIIGIKNV